jgi:hypothetical protein
MSSVAIERKTPWHVWVVAILTLLWNGSGAVTIFMAQRGMLPNLDPGEASYYAAQPSWFVVSTAVATLAPVAAGIVLLLRRRAAVALFALGVAAIVFNNTYELIAGTSRPLVDRGAAIVTTIIVVIALLQLAYAWRMRTRAVLT